MEINKHNYEAYFLDYYEGNLTPQQVADLLLFIEQHPAYKAEFESFENISLEDFTEYEFENKGSLKKEVNSFTLEEYLIKKTEGIITSPESELLERYLTENKSAQMEEGLFLKTKLTPETSIVFENKSSLQSDAQIEKASSVVLNESDVLLISALEGHFSKNEEFDFEIKLKNNEYLKQEYGLYLQTKLQPDYEVVADFKDSLKQKSAPKIIPFYYYFTSSVAAAVIVLFGLIYLFNQNTLPVQDFANTIKEENEIPIKITESIAVPESALANNTSPVNQKLNKRVYINGQSSSSLDVKQEQNATTPITDLAINKLDSVSNSSVTETKQFAIVQSNENFQNRNLKIEEKKAADYYTLKEMAVVKLKQKTLEEEVVEEQKKQGRLNKFNFWDLTQVVAKGINKITNSDVSVSPEYNDAGELTAYAFNAGKIGFSKGK